MSSNYYKIKVNNGTGYVSISSFEAMVTKVIKGIKGVSLYKNNENNYSKIKPIEIAISKDNKVSIVVNIVVNKEFDIKKICLEIKEEVILLIKSMVEIEPSLNINICSVN